GMRCLLWLLPLCLLGLRCHECLALRNFFQPTSCLNKQLSVLPLPGPPGQQVLVILSCASTCPGFQESLAYSRASCCNADLWNHTMSLSARGGCCAVLLALGWGMLL
uniref:Snake toxin/toxin-like domain-containing protein n=1 Tax=Sciurus vulgaris TaxID=55149 RepID=A0A8D2B8Y1_SCIVU